MGPRGDGDGVSDGGRCCGSTGWPLAGSVSPFDAQCNDEIVCARDRAGMGAHGRVGCGRAGFADRLVRVPSLGPKATASRPLGRRFVVEAVERRGHAHGDQPTGSHAAELGGDGRVGTAVGTMVAVPVGARVAVHTAVGCGDGVGCGPTSAS